MTRKAPDAKISGLNRPSRKLSLLIRLGLLVLFVALLYRFTNLRLLVSTLARISLGTFAACALLELAFYALESWRIQVLAGGTYSYRAIWRSRLLSALVSNFLPGMSSGELVRVFMLDTHRPGNKLNVALLLLANRLYGVLTLAALLLVSLLISRTQMSDTLRGRSLVVGFGLLVGLALPLALVHTRPVRGAMLKAIRKMDGKFRHIGTAFYLSIARFGAPRRSAFAIATSAVTTLLAVALFWLLGHAVGLELGPARWMLCVTMAGFSSFLPIGFGAIGPQDAGMALFAKLSGAPIESLLAVSLAIHVSRIAGTLPGLFYLHDAGPLLSGFFRSSRALLQSGKPTVDSRQSPQRDTNQRSE